MGIRPQPARMRSSGVGGTSGDRTRKLMRGRIFALLRRRHQQPINDALLTKLREIAGRLEEALYKAARTKEDSMNLDTLDQRLSIVVQRFQQARQNVNSGISMTAANSSMPPTTVNNGSLLPTGGVSGGSFSRPEGNI